jgi:hypothetical protein
MYFIFLILLCGINLIILFLGGWDLDTCFILFLINILTYPFCNLFLTTKTLLSSPIVKHLNYINLENFSTKREYIIYECKELVKYNVFWLFTVFFPFITSYALNKEFFANFVAIDTFIIASLFYLIAHIWVLSAIMRNFYLKFYWILVIVPGLLCQAYIAFIPKNKISFLCLSLLLIALTYITLIVLVSIIKTKNRTTN